MRIRQVKPAFWTDSRIAELPDSTRLFYVGLWMLADDGGWFRVDVPSMGAELYSYEGRAKRERGVIASLDRLKAAGRIVLHDCGHGVIPTFAEHQRLAGETKRVLTVKREHSLCPRIPANPRDIPPDPDTVSEGTGKVRDGSESHGTPRAGEPGGPLAESSEWQQKVDRKTALGAN